jgi:hypothetical protein
VEIEKREDVRFASGNLQLTGTLISPATGGKHPAIIAGHIPAGVGLLRQQPYHFRARHSIQSWTRTRRQCQDYAGGKSFVVA